MRVPKIYHALEAEGALTDAGLKLGNPTEASSDTVPAGGVIEQDPAAGTAAEKGTAVDIVVSTGPKQTPAVEQSAPAADVSAGSGQTPTAQTAATVARVVSTSSVYEETVQKESKEKKKDKK